MSAGQVQRGLNLLLCVLLLACGDGDAGRADGSQAPSDSEAQDADAGNPPPSDAGDEDADATEEMDADTPPDAESDAALEDGAPAPPCTDDSECGSDSYCSWQRHCATRCSSLGCVGPSVAAVREMAAQGDAVLWMSEAAQDGKRTLWRWEGTGDPKLVAELPEDYRLYDRIGHHLYFTTRAGIARMRLATAAAELWQPLDAASPWFTRNYAWWHIEKHAGVPTGAATDFVNEVWRRAYGADSQAEQVLADAPCGGVGVVINSSVEGGTDLSVYCDVRESHNQVLNKVSLATQQRSTEFVPAISNYFSLLFVHPKDSAIIAYTDTYLNSRPSTCSVLHATAENSVSIFSEEFGCDGGIRLYGDWLLSVFRTPDPEPTVAFLRNELSGAHPQQVLASLPFSNEAALPRFVAKQVAKQLVYYHPLEGRLFTLDFAGFECAADDICPEALYCGSGGSCVCRGQDPSCTECAQDAECKEPARGQCVEGRCEVCDLANHTGCDTAATPLCKVGTDRNPRCSTCVNDAECAAANKGAHCSAGQCTP